LQKYERLILQTIRQQIIALLEENPMDAMALSQALGIQEKDVYAHLTHIARSVGAKNRKLEIDPSKCLACGYIFKDRKRYTRPGRCPRCKQSHLQNPRYQIV